ncbi:ribbon-helix-helix domain-containing protein [Streptomyces sp. NBC_00878]|uniref:ribbon-helix-helix domain-containing protein n=1 Tax=Streptomyces sp. NBC_00878 TaxID=2975854 RepID=UPI0022529C6D|nr:ribbon-helix-helix domain-containing protein [Streptomyces sp. NBC_00878]MCX4906031.1 ribbon-helix-helix domain-containing protein [Streptomyces sp. NBC_00878]
MAAKKPISVTLDPDLLEELQRLVDAGEAASISAVINETLRSRVERRRRAEQAREYVEETLLRGQALTDEELVEARGMLAASKARTDARRKGAAA